ncbi:MAG: hypothetical protein AAFR77_11050 [Cyanobacteria bacterium J06631_2]
MCFLKSSNLLFVMNLKQIAKLGIISRCLVGMVVGSAIAIQAPEVHVRKSQANLRSF